MKYSEYREHREQGTFNFPIAYYHQTSDKPRYHMTYHWHTQYELIYIIDGLFHLTIDNDTSEYHPGDILFLTDGTLHGGTPSECVYDCIVFDLDMLMKSNHACAKTITRIKSHEIKINTILSGDSPEVVEITKALARALSNASEGYEFTVQGLLYQLFGIIMDKHLYTISTEGTVASGRLNSIKSVIAYISDNYQSNVTLDDLAKIAGMNPKYFCRYFKTMTERTPIDYLNYYRIECASELLNSAPHTPIRDVATACGFSDESYFIKTFHKYKGITPKQFALRNTSSSEIV